MKKILLILITTLTLIGCATNSNMGIVTEYGLNKNNPRSFSNTLYNPNDIVPCKDIEQNLFSQKNQDFCTAKINLYYLYLCKNGIAAFPTFNYSSYYTIDPKGNHYKLQYFSNTNEATEKVVKMFRNQQQIDFRKYESSLVLYNKNKSIAYLKYQQESKTYQTQYNKKLMEYDQNQRKIKKLEDINYKLCMNGTLVNSLTRAPYPAITCKGVAFSYLISDTIPRHNLKILSKPKQYHDFKYDVPAPTPPLIDPVLTENQFITKNSYLNNAVSEDQCENIKYYDWSKASMKL